MAVTALSLDPAEAARRTASPRVLARGETYFAAGAVLAARWEKPGVAHARVRGSEGKRYRVAIDLRRGRLAASCNCPFEWEPVCKHAVAACLALAAPSEQEPPSDREAALDEARRRELDARRASARTERFEIDLRPTRARPWFTVHSPRTRAAYEVGIWADAAFCTCADFRSSELGACKHILSLSKRREARAKLDRPLAFIQAGDTRGKVHDPLQDVRVLFPAGAPQSAFSALLDAGSFVDPACRALRNLSPGNAAAHVDELLAALPKQSCVRREVRALLASIREQAERRRERERFAQGVRQALRSKGKPPPAWQRSIGALAIRPHPYQVDGILFAAVAGRAILADDMGLGKTLQALGVARLLAELGDVRRTLVICPASLKHQWAKEARRAQGAEAKAAIAEGGRKVRAALYADPAQSLVIVNYEVAIRDLNPIRKAGFDLIVLDEAQRVKNWNTRTAKAIKALRSPFALVLTGTPLENRLGELHSIAEQLDLRVLGPAWRLVPEFGDRDPSGRLVGFSGLSLIRERLAPMLLRRERTLVLSQLPPRSEKVFQVPFTLEQKGPHDDHMQRAAMILSQPHLTQADVLQVMSHLTQARMLANGLSLYEFRRVEAAVRRGELPPAMAKLPSPKLAEIAQLLEDLLAEKGCKVVVFSQWERMLRLAAAAARGVLEAAGARPLFFHGSLSSKERAEIVTDFHDDPRARVFFSTDAGGVGLNLQEAASVVLHLEVPWNPAVLDQRVGRVHRMGQKNPVRVYSLVSQGSIEERISLTVKHKRELFDGLFRGTSDDLTFGDGTEGAGLAERLRTLVGRASPSLGELRQPIDKPVPIIPPLPEAEVAPEPPPAGLSTLDLGPLVNGLLGRLGGGALPVALPVTIDRSAGKLRLELPDLPPNLWQSLAAFAQAMAGGR